MDKESSNIKVIELLTSSKAISREHGETLFQLINQEFLNDKIIDIDFEGIEILLSVFLNASIGQLYGKYNKDYIDAHLKFKNMSDDDKATLEKVINRAIQYFENQTQIDKPANIHFPNG